jgi:hypothetical protein
MVAVPCSLATEPTEPVFHNCADVAITRSSNSPKTFGKIFGLVRYARVPFAPTETLSLINDDGMPRAVRSEQHLLL